MAALERRIRPNHFTLFKADVELDGFRRAGPSRLELPKIPEGTPLGMQDILLAAKRTL